MSNCIDMVTEHKVFELNDQVVSIEFNGVLPGPPGPAGPAGGSAVTWTAGQNLSTGRVVIIDNGEAFYFQPSNTAHQGRAYGITITSATQGANVDVQISGERADAAFSFTADTPVWVDADGEIVNTQPVTGALIQLAGVASGAKKLVIDFSLSIKRN